MRKSKSTRRTMIALCVAGLFTSVAMAGDWPHYRGPDYNGISEETAFDPASLKEGIKPVWEAEIGVGFSSISISDGRAYAMGNVDKINDVVFCFDADSGKEIWTHTYPEPLEPKYYDGGSSATPTVADGKVYTISKSGKIFCLNAATGDVMWQKQVESKPPTWGFAGSAVVQDKLVIFNVGAAGLALNKANGSVVWDNGAGLSGYSSAVPYTRDGHRCLVMFGQNHVFGLDTATGKQLWKSKWVTKHDVNASDPIVHGDYVFVASGYNRGCGLIKVDGATATKVYDTKAMRSQLSGPVLINGYLYGIDENQLVCLDIMTGEVKWKERQIGKGSLMAANGKLFVLSDKGILHIADASAKAFEPISSAQILNGKCWVMPVLANGKIYTKNVKGHMVCIDVSGKKSVASSATPSQWPQFRGPNRDGKSTETGLLKKWPEAGPKMLWSAQGLGTGYSAVSISGDTIYATGMVNKKGVLFALDMNGKPKWERTYGDEWTKSSAGVRGTPTIDGNRAYIISGPGEVFCYDAKTGDPKWTVDAFKKFDGKYGSWGIAESPLIDGNNIICTPGGSKATMVALNKMTGATVWTCSVGTEKSSYCSPILVRRGPNKIIVTMTDEYVFGVDAKTGTLLWKDSQKDQFGGENKTINPVSPIYHDGKVYATSGYDDGGAMLALSSDGTSFTREWVDETLDNHHGGVVFVDGHIYGSNWKGNGDGAWVCLDWNTGKVKYEDHWNNKGAITYADGMLYCYEEKGGNMALVRPTPEKFDVVSSFKVELGNGRHWAHPVVCGGTLYIRHGEVLMAYDIKEG